MKKNTKIGIGIGVIALLFIAYKKGLFSGSNSTDSGSTEASTPSLPIVDISSGSETPQVAVVNIPPQFGGEVVTASNVPTTAGSWQSFN
jgi:hypothetical protein